MYVYIYIYIYIYICNFEKGLFQFLSCSHILGQNKYIKHFFKKMKKKKRYNFLGFRAKNQERFAVNNSTCSYSFQYKFCDITLCYKMKITR